MTLAAMVQKKVVNCRIGSLESLRALREVIPFVNCRIGSLENHGAAQRGRAPVNCRIGSLEIHRPLSRRAN